NPVGLRWAGEDDQENDVSKKAALPTKSKSTAADQSGGFISNIIEIDDPSNQAVTRCLSQSKDALFFEAELTAKSQGIMSRVRKVASKNLTDRSVKNLAGISSKVLFNKSNKSMDNSNGFAGKSGLILKSASERFQNQDNEPVRIPPDAGQENTIRASRRGSIQNSADFAVAGSMIGEIASIRELPESDDDFRQSMASRDLASRNSSLRISTMRRRAASETQPRDMPQISKKESFAIRIVQATPPSTSPVSRSNSADLGEEESADQPDANLSKPEPSVAQNGTGKTSFSGPPMKPSNEPALPRRTGTLATVRRTVVAGIMRRSYGLKESMTTITTDENQGEVVDGPKFYE
ncbi:hypothetical protein HDV05_000269, partial [Chytridiales sp. JEL 0842]